MNFEFFNKRLFQNWLTQFAEDKDKALELIKDINFIDQVDYDLYTSNIVDKIVKSSSNFKHVYIIPINSLITGAEPKSDSAFAFNIKKKLPAKIRPFWNFDTRIERNSIIYFVDEFIGSGNTFLNNINIIDSITLKRIRSLSSYNEIEVHIASIVIYKTAIQLLGSSFKFINSFIFEKEGTSFQKKKYKAFLDKYITKSKCKKAIFGYNKNNIKYEGILSNIVFYNNCPNNTPSILWCQQGTSKPLPIFHGKKVSLTYRTVYYKEKQKYQRIIKHIDKSSSNSKIFKEMLKNENYSTVVDCLIFLIDRDTIGIEKFKFNSNSNDNKLKTIICLCHKYKFITNARRNGQLTKNGKLVIKNLIKVYDDFFRNSREKKEQPIENQGILLYYPIQIKGIKPNVQ